MSAKIKRSVYAGTFGPTIGDRVRLADTDLIVDVEKDFVVYGEGVNSAEAGDRRVQRVSFAGKRATVFAAR